MGRIDDITKLSVARLRGVAEHEDPVLYPGETPFLATGFWIALREGHPAYCTNKHNLVPSIKKTGLRLIKLEIELRSNDLPNPTFHRVMNLERALWVHETADCAIIVFPDFENGHASPIPTLREEWLANSCHFERLQISDEAFFIGFPGFDGEMWFDEAHTFPIARNITIASIPSIPFTNSKIHTTDTTLVAGLSFTGSSGSLVVNRRIGIAPGGDIHDPTHVPSLVIGVMTGHFSEPSPQLPGALRHGGLSYFTRSTAFLEVIEEARRVGFRRT